MDRTERQPRTGQPDTGQDTGHAVPCSCVRALHAGPEAALQCACVRGNQERRPPDTAGTGVGAQDRKGADRAGESS